METRSKVHYHNLIRWSADKPNVLVLSADLTGSCEADGFRDAYPGRFISCGIAEQNMLSVAGGLCREGFIPLVHTFAVFIYRRAYDQVAMSVAYPDLPVKMFGFLPGVTTPGGATHQALEDLALMRALPNMTVIETGDATEVENVLDLAFAVDGPVYIRMLRGEMPVLFPRTEKMQLDVPRILSKGTDLTLLSSGICTEEALRAVAALEKRGVSVTHAHVSTLKPFNNSDYADILDAGRYGIITFENHTTTGGLGTVVTEKACSLGINKRIVKLGIRDTFMHGASRPYLMQHYGIDALALVKAFEALAGSRLDLTQADFSAVRPDTVPPAAKAESL